MPEQGEQPVSAGVQAVVRLIAGAVMPEKIYLLGPPKDDKAEAGGYLELLVVIPASNPSSFPDLEPVVRFACLGHRNVCCTLSKADHVQKMLNQGHAFYSLSCVPENLVYSNGSPGFTPTPPELLRKVREESLREFNANLSKAKTFYDMAKRQHSVGNRELVPFLLHQAAELTLRAVLVSLLGREKRTHSIKVLLRNVRLIAPALSKVFPRDTERERRLVHLLEEAYLRSRYDSGFSLEESVVVELMWRVGKLKGGAQEVIGKRMKVLKSIKQ